MSEGREHTDHDTASALAELSPVTLRELDERARLLHRVDVKYMLDSGRFAELLGLLANDHDVLEIDGRRTFAYRSMYFDTGELRCHSDHEHGRLPRFKSRTRHYLDTGECVFEVKVKLHEDETDKHQTEHPVEHESELTEHAIDFLAKTLASAGIAMPADPLGPTLRTSFHRRTLAARDGSERLTCDTDVLAERPGRGRAELDEGLILLETKSAEGSGRADRELRRLGAERLSLSKYRVGMGVLIGEQDLPDAARLFHVLG